MASLRTLGETALTEEQALITVYSATALLSTLYHLIISPPPPADDPSEPPWWGIPCMGHLTGGLLSGAQGKLNLDL